MAYNGNQGKGAHTVIANAPIPLEPEPVVNGRVVPISLVVVGEPSR